MTGIQYSEITTKTPYKSLTCTLKKNAWRNSLGRITIRHQWWGHAKKYRLIDFHLTDKKDIPANVETIEYDPYRSAFIALVCYKDWERRYVLAHSEMKVWDIIITQDKSSLSAGNRMKIGNIPVWMKIYNVELIVGKGVSSVRSAWSSAKLVSQEWKYSQVKLPSGEIRLVHKECFANLGQVSNPDHNQVIIWKAWRARWMWKRPEVRGKAMNPVDHPHGGGEGRSPIGMKAPKTPQGKIALGKKTRNAKKWSSRLIVRTRKGKLLV